MEELLFIVVILMLVAGLIILVTVSRTEVKPATALVYNNIWNGKTFCVLPGTEFIIPGIHRVLEREVSLRNEAENPDNVELITGDGIELEVDYIVRRLRVGYPGMPANIDDANPDKLKEAVIKAVTAISYSERRDKVLTRIVARMQEEVKSRTYAELFQDADIENGKVGKVNKVLMKSLEEEVNILLSTDIVSVGWGYWVEMDLEDYNLPARLRQAREASASADMAGKAIADKATAAGVDPRWIIAGETLGNIFGKGGKA